MKFGAAGAFGAHGHNGARGVQLPRGEWDIASLTRFAIRSIDNHENEYVSKWRRRSILAAEVTVGLRPVRVYSLHFDPLPTATAYIRARQGESQLILGDFNLTQVPELPPAGYTDVLNSAAPHRYRPDLLLRRPLQKPGGGLCAAQRGHVIRRCIAAWRGRSHSGSECPSPIIYSGGIV